MMANKVVVSVIQGQNNRLIDKSSDRQVSFGAQTGQHPIPIPSPFSLQPPPSFFSFEPLSSSSRLHLPSMFAPSPTQ